MPGGTGGLEEAMFYEKLGGAKVRCTLCAHRCVVAPSRHGICRVRRNEGGSLYTAAYGRAIAAGSDPVEKKPLFHFLPGTRSFSIATMGCNFQCGFCQNWRISQVSRSGIESMPGEPMTPAQIVRRALREGCRSISYTYTEPTIFFEYALDTARLAKEEGLCNFFVTNGYMTREALDAVSSCLDAANVDLKSFRDSYYKRVCKARLQPVLDTIACMKELGVWVEVTTLVVPGENDSRRELEDIASFIAGTDRGIPWHISRFHPDFKYGDRRATPMETLRAAAEIGREAGLRFVYLGNVAEGADTRCPGCGALLVERNVFSLESCRIQEGRCPSCGAEIEGVWSL